MQDPRKFNPEQREVMIIAIIAERLGKAPSDITDGQEIFEHARVISTTYWRMTGHGLRFNRHVTVQDFRVQAAFIA